MDKKKLGIAIELFNLCEQMIKDAKDEIREMDAKEIETFGGTYFNVKPSKKTFSIYGEGYEEEKARLLKELKNKYLVETYEKPHYTIALTATIDSKNKANEIFDMLDTITKSELDQLHKAASKTTKAINATKK